MAIEAGSLGCLQLEELDNAHCLTRRGGEPEVSFRCDEHQAGGRDVEHDDAAIDEQRQEINHVEVVDQRVGELDEGFGQYILVCHTGLLGAGVQPHITSQTSASELRHRLPHR